MSKPRVFLLSAGECSQYDQHNPPIGLLYIAAWLRAKYPVELCVVSQRTDNLTCREVVDRIREFAPDIVGIGSMTPHAHVLPTLVEGIRAVSPDALIVLGGPHILAYTTQVLEEAGADLAVAGEGELTMEMIVEAWLGNRDYSGIPGLLRRTVEGEITTNPGVAPVIEDLDTMPFPAYDLIDLSRYWRLNSQMLLPYPRRYVMMFTSRGCPYDCGYCSNVFGTRFRAASAERIVEELGMYIRQYGVTEVLFFDDCFNLSRDRVVKFCDLLLQKHGPINIAFPNGVRADLLDERTIDALVRAGMYCCHFALETGSPRLQKFVNKNLNIEKYLESVRIATSKGVYAHGFVMLGLPTETEEEMRQTIRVASESRLHSAEFFSFTPLPNIALTAYVRERMPEKLKNVSFMNHEYWRTPINCSAVSDDMFFYYQRKAYRDFYFRPGRIYRILRDYPKPLYLPSRVLPMLQRMGKGLFRKTGG